MFWLACAAFLQLAILVWFVTYIPSLLHRIAVALESMVPEEIDED